MPSGNFFNHSKKPFNHYCAYTIGPPSEGALIRQAIADITNADKREVKKRIEKCRRTLLESAKKARKVQTKTQKVKEGALKRNNIFQAAPELQVVSIKKTQ